MPLTFTVLVLWLRLDVVIEKLGQLAATLETTTTDLLVRADCVGLNHTVLLRPFQFSMDYDSKSSALNVDASQTFSASHHC